MSECRVSTCARPAGDAFCCSHCGDALAQALNETPWLVDELNIVITKQARYGSGGGSKSVGKVQPLPLDIRASDALSAYAGLLGSWVRMFCEENDGWKLPKGDPASLARWLVVRVNDIRHHAAGNDCISEVCGAFAAGRYAVDRPADRWYAGPCNADLDDEVLGVALCGVDLYATAGAQLVTCRNCSAEYDVKARRDWLLTAAEDQLADAVTIARAVSWMGAEPLTAERVRQWASRGFKGGPRLLPKATIDGRPHYRVGDAIDMLAKSSRRS
jgi:hypothetical protein